MGAKLHSGAATFLLLVLFAFVSPCLSQDIEILQRGVVKVTSTTLEGKRKIGTGFVVRLGADVVYIVTASHVIEGARDIEVAFFTGKNRLIAAKVLDLEGGDPQGLAALAVEGKIPAGVSVLKMNRVTLVRAGEPVTMIGFPDAGGPWAVTKGEIVGRKGKSIAFSGAVEEGNSGGPLIKEGQVIGVVTEARVPFAYATPTPIAQYVLESWGIKFGDQLRSKPARLEEGHIVQMIREKGFHHPGDLSKDGLSGSVRGNFEHEYELKTLNDDPVVIDHATGLMWQQSGSSSSLDWKEVKGYIDELNKEGYAGFSDWRLPTLEELASLMEYTGENEGLYIDPVFDKDNYVFWSADESSRFRWVVNYSNGTLYLGGPARALGVRSTLLDSQKGPGAPTPTPARTEVGVDSQLANTKIAFVSEGYRLGEIHVMDADGTNPRRLIGSLMEVSRPAWSPDRTKLAFASQRDSKGWEIQVINADGTNPRHLIDGQEHVSYPFWSPDGTKLIFASWHSPCIPDVHVINADGTHLRRLAYNKAGPTSCIVRMDWSAAWSPDGRRIALPGNESENWIHMINADGSNLKRYTPLKDGADYRVSLAWSPDGTKLAFMSSESDSNGIYVMNADGTNPKPLIRARVAGGDTGGLSWSPDGSKIAFVSMEHDNAEIYVINADGTDPRRLTNTPGPDVQPSWSPDGTKIVFASMRAGNWEIYMMNADGTYPRRMTKTRESEKWPAWSPFLK
jgi:Tol biopolymer transport system component